MKSMFGHPAEQLHISCILVNPFDLALQTSPKWTPSTSMSIQMADFNAGAKTGYPAPVG